MPEVRFRPTATQSSTEALRPMNPPSFSHTRDDGRISASTLLNSSPTHDGQVMKLNIPLFFTFCPSWFQKILFFCPSPLRPTWKKRYLIQIGKYVYRFSNSNSPSTDGVPSQMTQKGSPIPLDKIQAKVVDANHYGMATSKSRGVNMDENIALLQHLPSYCDGFFSITTSGQTKYYAVSTKEDAVTWVNSILEGRQASITNSMGHDQRPYPKAWKYIDQRGDAILQKKVRIKDRIRSIEKREMEMTEMSHGMTGAMPRGYFG